MSTSQQPPFSMPGGIPGMPQSYQGGAPGAGDGKKPKKVRGEKPPKAAKNVSARDTARRNFLIAGVLGLVAVIATFAINSEPKETSVFVARVANAKGLAAGRPVEPADIEYVQMPLSNVESGAAYSSDKAVLEKWMKGIEKAPLLDAKTGKTVPTDWQVIGRRPKYPVLAGQQIRPYPVFTETFDLALPLGADESLVTLSVPADRAVLGNLRPGDLVDIVAAVTSKTETTGGAGEPAVVSGPVVVASRVEIVSMKSGAALGGLVDTGVPSVYLVRTSSDMALKLAALDANDANVLYLILRGKAAETSAGTPSSTTTTTQP